MSLNTHPHHFRFALRDEVKVILSGAGFIGHVIGQATSLYAQDSFLVQYKGAQGTPAMEWFHEGQLEHSNIYRSAWGELMKEWLEDGVLRTPQHQEGVNIDAAHHAEARAEETAVAQANVATDTPKPRLFGFGTLKITPTNPEKLISPVASLDIGHSSASVSLYIPDIEQKPGESLTDFLLRAAAALQGQAATL